VKQSVPFELLGEAPSQQGGLTESASDPDALA
jgi:hypothetical protein